MVIVLPLLHRAVQGTQKLHTVTLCAKAAPVLFSKLAVLLCMMPGSESMPLVSAGSSASV